jgi:two-component system heavy metal sensor histidine kinase CusS
MFDRLAASFEQVRRFTADASHELKTPLALVRLHAEKMLMSGGLSQSHRESVHVQLEELARLSQMIEELLFLSRADAHAIKLSPKLQDPAAFLQNIAPDAAALAEHHGCKFTYSHSDTGHVDFEANRMRQVLLNLLANAIKVSPPGGTITLDSQVQRETWRITVADEGPGLQPEQQEKMFDRFVRFSSGDADDRGSGLGLAICRSIVELYGGRIHAEHGANGCGLRTVIEMPAVGRADADATITTLAMAKGEALASREGAP